MPLFTLRSNSGNVATVEAATEEEARPLAMWEIWGGLYESSVPTTSRFGLAQGGCGLMLEPNP